MKIDNKKFKKHFNEKARFIKAEELKEANTCIKIDVDYLEDITKGIWVDVCKD